LPTLTHDQLAALARSGVTNRGIEATLGRAMTADERAAVDRARVVAQLQREVRRSKAPKSNAQRQAEHVARRSEIGPIPPPKDPARREACRLDMLRFGLTYCMLPAAGAILKRPPSEKMMDYIRALQDSYLDDRMVHPVFPRGKGKTAWLKIGELWAASYGHRRYLFLGAANQTNADAILNDVWECMEESEPYAEDFPEVAIPVRALEGRMQRCAVQTCDGKLTKIKRGKDRICFPRIKGSPSSGVLFISRGRESGVRGLVKGSQRPDHVAIDDPQTRKTAKSETGCDDIAAWITGDVLGLAGHDRSISACLTTTPIYAGDVSDTFGDPDLHPEWTTIRVPMVLKWPERSDLWDEYLERRRRDELMGLVNFPNATDFYRQNRAEMDRGAVVLDDKDGDPKTELSAVQHVYNLLFKHGKDSFASEFQLSPPRGSAAFTLTAKMVASNLSLTPRFECPEGFHAAVAFVDCMSRDALRWVVVAVGSQRRSTVIAYGRYPEKGAVFEPNALVTEQNKLFAVALDNLINLLCGTVIKSAGGNVRLSGIGVDRGWKPRIVEWVCSRSKHSAILYPALGYAWSKYAPERPDGKARANVLGVGDHCYLAKGKGFRYLGQHADYWREYAQRSFLAPALTAGASAIYGADMSEHHSFASEIVAETLADKGVGQNGTEFWRWVKRPGTSNHYLDCFSGALMLASWLRLFDATQTLAKRPGAGNRPKRKPRLKLIRKGV